MKISSSRNIFDLLYLDILDNSIENILSLNCEEECRSLTCFLQHARKEIKHPENSMHAHIFYLQNNYATEALISLVAALHCAGCRAVLTKLFGCSHSRRARHSRSSAVLLKAIESGCT